MFWKRGGIMRNYILTLTLFALVITIIGCGGGNGNGGGPKQDITVSLSPKTVSVAGDATQQFTATILNPHNTGVTWTLSGSGCTGSACGTLGNYGGNNNQGWTATYTAPLTVPNPATVTVKATSVDDTSKSDTATITVTAPVVTVSVTPAAPTVILGATQQFTANVRGTTNTAVTWSTPGPGTIDSSGLYSAPATLTTPSTATVTATSQADTTKSGSATITIPAVTVAVLPHASAVILGASQQFTATVTNATNTAVTWSMSGPGSVSASGLYTAPATLTTPATATVRAVSQADPNKTMSITFSIPAVAVGVSPASPTVILGATQQFTAPVSNATNTAVTWSMTGVGTISSTGLYTAPATLTTPSSATVIATSVADPTKSAGTTLTIPAVAVSVAPPNVSLNGGGSQAFTATVTNATNKTVTWSLTGLGTLDANGAYTAPTVVPSQQTATVNATSSADPSKSGSAVITLIPISVSVSPSAPTVPVKSTQQFAAAVAGTSNSAVTWSVSGTGCTGSTCGTINATGLYTAPDDVPTPPTVTVTAVSAVDVTKSGTATVTITDNANIKLKGSFAFLFQGFLGSGMTATLGSFTADGNGNLTNGLRDVNTVGGSPVVKQSFTGTYQLHGDNRGTMTFTSLPGSPSFRFAINDGGDKGTMVEIDSTATTGGGMFRKQTTTDFVVSKVTGDYAWGFYGSDMSGERIAAVGRMHADGVATISAGDMDTSDGARTQFTGSFAFSSATGSANGRGTMSIVVPNPGGGTFPATFYAVNANQIFFIMSSQVGLDSPLLLGEIRRQTGVPFSSSSLNGAAVFYSNDLSNSPGTTKAIIGQFVANGSNSLSGEMAISDGGTPTPQADFTATYSISINGRSLFDSADIGGRAIFYLTGQNTAFLLWPGAGLGTIEPQTLPVGGLKTSDLAGRYLVAGTQVPVSSGSAFSGYVDIDGTGSWTSTVDVSSQLFPAVDLFNAGLVSVASATTGRVTMTVTVPSTFNQVIYAATPDKLLLVDIDPSTSNTGALFQATGFWEK
jgi:hypothetical protein